MYNAGARSHVCWSTISKNNAKERRLNMKILSDKISGIREKVLSVKEFKLFCDLDSYSFSSDKMKEVVEKAVEYLDTEPEVIPLSKHRNYERYGRIQDYSAPWADRLRKMMYLGFAEAYESKERFTLKLIDYIWAILEESSWMVAEHSHVTPMGVKTSVPLVAGDKYLHGLELGSLYRAATLSLVYSLNKDKINAVSSLIGERIVKSMKERIIKPFLAYPFHWSGEMGNKVNNWCPWCVSNLLLIVALTEEDMEVRRTAVERGMRYLDNFVNGYAPDGGCDEGPTYWGAAIGCLFDSLEILYDMTGGAVDVFDTPLLKKMGEYICTLNIVDNKFISFADSGCIINLDGALLQRFGRKVSSTVLASLGDRMEAGGGVRFSYGQPYRALRAVTTAPVKGSDIDDKASLFSAYPDLQVMVVRDSENPHTGICFGMKAGTNGESHNHNDIGSFVLYKDGEPVLIDAGVGAYTKDTFGPNRYKIWSMRSEYHNLPIISGKGQLPGRQYAAKDVCISEEDRLMRADISLAYPKDAGIISYVREGSLKDGIVTIRDTLSLEQKSEVDFIFMTVRKPQISDTCILLHMGCVLEFDKRLTPEVEEFEPVGIDTESRFGTKLLYRIHLKSDVKSDSFTFKIRQNQKVIGEDK